MQRCSGKRLDAAGPLSPSSTLSKVEVPSGGGNLQDALSSAGYGARRVQVVTLSGPASADAAMTMLRERYCRTLMAQRFADIGVSRDDGRWRIILAQPLLSKDLEPWPEAGKEVLDLVNEARAEARTCGKQRFESTGPLTWNDKLGATALAHSRDMARRNYFAHKAKDGSTVSDRARRNGYRWRSVGENIAAGQGSPRQVVAGWIASPPHCANIMHASFTEMGAAYVVNLESDGNIYWTQVFGRPR